MFKARFKSFLKLRLVPFFIALSSIALFVYLLFISQSLSLPLFLSVLFKDVFLLPILVVLAMVLGLFVHAWQMWKQNAGAGYATSPFYAYLKFAWQKSIQRSPAIWRLIWSHFFHSTAFFLALLLVKNAVLVMGTTMLSSLFLSMAAFGLAYRIWDFIMADPALTVFQRLWGLIKRPFEYLSSWQGLFGLLWNAIAMSVFVFLTAGNALFIPALSSLWQMAFQISIGSIAMTALQSFDNGGFIRLLRFIDNVYWFGWRSVFTWNHAQKVFASCFLVLIPLVGAYFYWAVPTAIMALSAGIYLVVDFFRVALFQAVKSGFAFKEKVQTSILLGGKDEIRSIGYASTTSDDTEISDSDDLSASRAGERCLPTAFQVMV